MSSGVTLSAPTALVAIAGDNQISLDWADNSESILAGYNVYRSTTSGGSYSLLTSTPVTSSDFQDTGLSNGVSYYYVVTAVDGVSSESDTSVEVTTAAGRSTPFGVSVTPENGVVALNTPTDLTGRFVDANGQDEVWLAEFRVTTGFTNAPRCFVRYDHNANVIRLYDDGPRRWFSAGAPGSGGSISNANCTLDAAASSVTVVDAITLDVQLNLSFTPTMEGNKNVWLRSFEDSRTWGERYDLGDWVISADTSAPAAPSGVTGTAGDSEAYLDWNDNVESDVAGYHVHRATTSGGPYTQLTSSPVTSSQYTDSGLTNSQAYYYVITAMDTSNNESSLSLETVVTPVADTTAPSAPSLSSVTSGDTELTLDWSDNSELDLAGYHVYRATTTGGGYTLVNAIPLTSSDFVDQGLSNGVTYYYVVKAVDGSGNLSADSNEQSGTPEEDVTTPSAPASLTAIAGDAQVTLDWPDNSESNLAGYNVYRSTIAGGPYNQVSSSLLTSSAYVDTGLINGTTYYYVVTAETSSGTMSPNSPEAISVAGPVAPVSESVTPNNATVSVGTNFDLTGRFIEGNGEDDLWLAEFRVTRGVHERATMFCALRSQRERDSPV